MDKEQGQLLQNHIYVRVDSFCIHKSSQKRNSFQESSGWTCSNRSFWIQRFCLECLKVFIDEIFRESCSCEPQVIVWPRLEVADKYWPSGHGWGYVPGWQMNPEGQVAHPPFKEAPDWQISIRLFEQSKPGGQPDRHFQSNSNEPFSRTSSWPVNIIYSLSPSSGGKLTCLWVILKTFVKFITFISRSYSSALILDCFLSSSS